MNKLNLDLTSGYQLHFVSPRASSLLPQQRGSGPTIVFLERNILEPLQQISVSRNAPAPFREGPATTPSLKGSQSASTSGSPSSYSQNTGRHPAAVLTLQTGFQYDPQTSSAGYSLRSVSEGLRTAAKNIMNKSTCISGESPQLEHYPKLVSLLNSPLKRQINELTALSKKQKPSSFSSPTELPSTPRKHETISAKQETRNFSGTIKMFSSKKQVTAVSPRKNKEKLLSLVETIPSREQGASESTKQQTGLRPIYGEPTSSSPGSSLKNPSFQDSKALQGTGIKKDIDRLEKRLKSFAQLTCVECQAEFATQDELLRHEPIHFND